MPSPDDGNAQLPLVEPGQGGRDGRNVELTIQSKCHDMTPAGRERRARKWAIRAGDLSSVGPSTGCCIGLVLFHWGV